MTPKALKVENQVLEFTIMGRILSIYIILVCLAAFAAPAAAQVVVDRTVATVTDGSRTELITYSDLLWQLALQPGVPIDPPRETDLNTALQRLIDQRIFALEAQRLPRAAPTDKEISDKIAELLAYFPSAAEFENRLKAVGFDSIKDADFENLISQRLAIEKYLDFRFRSFIVITAEEETKYYQDVWVPAFRRRNPGVIVPPLADVRAAVDSELTEVRVATSMESFLEDAKRRMTVVTFPDVK